LDTFKLNGASYSFRKLESLQKQRGVFTGNEIKTIEAIHQWLSGERRFAFNTSGSTGTPKKVHFTREQIAASAQRTIEFFELQPGDTILCCLNTQFVAGFMMLIRGIIGGLKLIIVDPVANPLKHIHEQSIAFVALTPIQAQAALNEAPEKLSKVGQILLGGAALHPGVEKQLKTLDCSVFHSFAMTETLTHVAMRNISIGDELFVALPKVSFAVDAGNCLIIDDDLLQIKGMATNDVVKLHGNYAFQWVGRSDYVVNSGAIKIHLELLEDKIRHILEEAAATEEICLAARDDERLGQKLVLLVQEGNHHFDGQQWLKRLKLELPPYHAPKEVLVVPQLFLTSTGKMDRKENIRCYLSKD
jgi:O-succinylbenzoic acid--CoA ligase